MRQRIGFQSQQGVPFPDARVASLIRFCAPLYPNWDRELEAQMLSRFGIDPKRRLKAHSQGQQRAVALLLAICPRPELLILDEPASNLDAVVRREFLDAVLGLAAEEGRTVIFSSHILSDVERAADRIAIVHQGRLLLERSLDDLKEQSRRLRFLFADRAPADIALPGLVARRRSDREILATVVGYDADATARLATSLRADVEAHPLGLEDLFIDLVGHDDGLAASA
jgi:ABC-2 type transport system ATP-binding protein